MQKNQGPVYYGDYLKLQNFLDTQHPVSKEYGNESHDEMLFIVVHQAFELWFKQILHELDSAMEIMGSPTIEEKQLSTILARLERIIKIQSLLTPQLEVLETMTPLDFLEFRDLLIPASGFQSVQFREIEIKLGLSTRNRQKVNEEFFLGRLSQSDRERISKIEVKKSMFQLLEDWLERMPFTSYKGIDFWDEYQKKVHDMVKKDMKIIKTNVMLSDTEKEAQLASLMSTLETFESLFDEDEYQKLVKAGTRKLSRKATLNALFIHLYREEPVLYLPFRVLFALKDIDENFTSWRYRHALLAQRMIGTKVGTGGSAGHRYLKMAAEKNRVFVDILDLSTFLIPKSFLPELPENIKKDLNFYISEKK